MKVQKIIQNALTLINQPETYFFISGGDVDLLNDNDKNTYNTLMACVNLTNNILASEYYPLRETISLTSNGKVSYSELGTNLIINQIFKVESNGKSVSFKEYPTYIETVAGDIKIYFSYVPKEIIHITENINCYPTKLTERIFAYGVVSEYYFIMGMYDDASIWDARFKNSLSTVLKPKHEIKIKSRLWI